MKQLHQVNDSAPQFKNPKKRIVIGDDGYGKLEEYYDDRQDYLFEKNIPNG